MSQIIEKEFDAEKKIVRSEFKGSPNLFTTADLNRQIEAIKYQLDQLDAKTCVQSDLNVIVQDTGLLTVTGDYTYMNVFGCSFKPTISGLTIEPAPAVYLLLTAKKNLVTYDDDFSHEISGAKFQDGTSMSAADHYVYYEEQVVLSTTLSVNNFIAVLAVISKNSAGEYAVSSNCLTKENSLLRVSMQNYLKDYNPQTYTPIKNGDSYDEAISKIGAKLSLVGGVYPISEYSLNSATSFAFVIDRNTLSFIEVGDIIEIVAMVTIRGNTGGAANTTFSNKVVVTNITKISGEPKPVVFEKEPGKYEIGGYSYIEFTLSSGLGTVLLNGDSIISALSKIDLIIYKKQ